MNTLTHSIIGISAFVRRQRSSSIPSELSPGIIKTPTLGEPLSKNVYVSADSGIGSFSFLSSPIILSKALSLLKSASLIMAKVSTFSKPVVFIKAPS
jgi:hypothetical protein